MKMLTKKEMDALTCLIDVSRKAHCYRANSLSDSVLWVDSATLTHKECRSVFESYLKMAPGTVVCYPRFLEAKMDLFGANKKALDLNSFDELSHDSILLSLEDPDYADQKVLLTPMPLFMLPSVVAACAHRTAKTYMLSGIVDQVAGTAEYLDISEIIEEFSSLLPKSLSDSNNTISFPAPINGEKFHCGKLDLSVTYTENTFLPNFKGKEGIVVRSGDNAVKLFKKDKPFSDIMKLKTLVRLSGDADLSDINLPLDFVYDENDHLRGYAMKWINGCNLHSLESGVEGFRDFFPDDFKRIDMVGFSIDLLKKIIGLKEKGVYLLDLNLGNVIYDFDQNKFCLCDLESGQTHYVRAHVCGSVGYRFIPDKMTFCTEAVYTKIVSTMIYQLISGYGSSGFNREDIFWGLLSRKEMEASPYESYGYSLLTDDLQCYFEQLFDNDDPHIYDGLMSLLQYLEDYYDHLERYYPDEPLIPEPDEDGELVLPRRGMARVLKSKGAEVDVSNLFTKLTEIIIDNVGNVKLVCFILAVIAVILFIAFGFIVNTK